MENRSRKARNTARTAMIVTAMLLAPALGLSEVEGQQAPVVLHTSTEQIPLKAYAEMMRVGTLRLASGSSRDIPTVTDVSYFRCSLTGWSPKGVLVSSEELFTSEYAERRLLPVSIRPLAVSTVAARAADLEKPERLTALGTAVKAPEGGDQLYFFLILSSGDLTRYYPFRIAIPKQ